MHTFYLSTITDGGYGLFEKFYFSARSCIFFERFWRFLRIANNDMARAGDRSFEEWRDLAFQANYRANALSRMVGVSPRQLRRDTKRLFRRSPQDWLDEQRLARAAGMLRKYQSVKEVAFVLGFKQISHFSREFKLYYGIPPSEFLRWDLQQSLKGRAQEA